MFGGFNTQMIHRERDPIFSDIERKVFDQLRELTKDDVIVVQKRDSVRTVSFEDAIKELAEFKKSSNKL